MMAPWGVVIGIGVLAFFSGIVVGLGIARLQDAEEKSDE